MKNTLFTLLRFLVGIGLIYLLYRNLEDPSALWQQISQANKLLLLIGASCYTAAVALSAVKWGVLLQASGIRIAIGRLLAYQWVAEFFNNFLPAQVGGDVMRGYALASDTHRAADAAASVLVDRFIGLLVFMVAAAFAALAMLFWGRPNGASLSGDELLFTQFTALGSAAMALALSALLAIILSQRSSQWLEQLLNRVPFAKYTVPIWQKLAQVFGTYRRHKEALIWTALGSTLIVFLTSINIWLIARAIEPDQIAFLEVLAINPIIVARVPLPPPSYSSAQARI